MKLYRVCSRDYFCLISSINPNVFPFQLPWSITFFFFPSPSIISSGDCITASIQMASSPTRRRTATQQRYSFQQVDACRGQYSIAQIEQEFGIDNAAWRAAQVHI